MAQDDLTVVRGRQVDRLDGRVLRQAAARAARVVVDVGAGDGRWAYRLARAHRDWLCLAVEPNAAALRPVAIRARRAPACGGTGNVWFIRAAAEALPGALAGLADEIHIRLPWGSLLRAVLAPEPAMLRGIARLGRADAPIFIRINASVLNDQALLGRLNLPPLGKQDVVAQLAGGYAAAGIELAAARMDRDGDSSWARRLGGGRPVPVVVLEGRVTGDGSPGEGVAPSEAVTMPEAPARGRQ